MGSISKIMSQRSAAPDTDAPPAEANPEHTPDTVATDDATNAPFDPAAQQFEDPPATTPPAPQPAAPAPPPATGTRFESHRGAAGYGDSTRDWDAARVDPAVVSFHNRYAVVCEQYRSIRARLQSMNPSHAHRVIAITSSVPEEGKSVTTANLGVIMAEGGEQQILIADTDFRRASLGKMLGVPSTPGLAEVITGEVALKDAVQPTPFPNLKLIPAGRLGDLTYGELLSSQSVRGVIEQLRSTFNYCLLDTPPVTTVSDVSLLAPLCDAALMVIEMGRTPEPTVQLAVRTLQTNNVNVCGCVLSRYRDQRLHYYDRYHYYYHRR
jgi:capsular exopolysaccharide synthesis family protein